MAIHKIYVNTSKNQLHGNQKSPESCSNLLLAMHFNVIISHWMHEGPSIAMAVDLPKIIFDK